MRVLIRRIAVAIGVSIINVGIQSLFAGAFAMGMVPFNIILIESVYIVVWPIVLAVAIMALQALIRYTANETLVLCNPAVT